MTPFASLAASDAPEVHLLAPGVEPRAILAYEIQPGGTIQTRARLELTRSMKSAARQNAPGISVEDVNHEPPPIEIRLTSRTLNSKPEEGFRIERRVEAAAVSEPLAPDATPAKAQAHQLAADYAAGIAGRTFPAVMLPNGSHTSRQVPESSEGELGLLSFLLLDALEPIFPDEPVGVGARWTVKRTVEVERARIPVETEFRLTAREGAVVAVEGTFKGELASQWMDLPGAVPGAKAELQGIKVEGGGSSRIDLKRPAPLAQTHQGTFKGNIIMTLPFPEAGEQLPEITFDMVFDVKMRRELSEYIPTPAPTPAKSDSAVPAPKP